MDAPKKRVKVDPRLVTMIQNGVRRKHRTLLLVIGDEAHRTVGHIHYMLQKAGKARPSVLWCYKDDLAMGSSDKRKREKLTRKAAASEGAERITSSTGSIEEDLEHDPFEVFLRTTDIRYVRHFQTHQILGNTYGMCVVQDFDIITPNLLARSFETVEGGGCICILLRNFTTLRALYTLAMEAHNKYRSNKFTQQLVSRFNERFLLSLGDLDQFLAIDDQLSVVPFTQKAAIVQPVSLDEADGFRTENERKLVQLRQELNEHPSVGPLLRIARTFDQAQTVMDLLEIVVKRDLKCTAAITAPRGRGKSAALGLAVAGAIAQGFSNVFVTSPSPENLTAFFAFAVKALEEYKYKQGEHYEIIQATRAGELITGDSTTATTNPKGATSRCVIRIDIFKSHRQTIQYVSPRDSSFFAQAELIVIDEAAAIPLPTVQKLLHPCTVFMASTVNGYEGTGRSLSLKLIDNLKKGGSSGRRLKEIELREPIRYAPLDPIEKWLNTVLCLDASVVAKQKRKTSQACPHPDQCELYYVNRDALFSYHPGCEELLQKMVSLFVSAHYRNQPDDVQLMADAPGHHLFVLMPPLDPSLTSIPDPLCVIQCCEEGQLARREVEDNLGKGQRPNGDLVPYSLAQQFQAPQIGMLSGVRVVRIAVEPELHRMKYGTRALQQLLQFYNGEVAYDGDAEEEASDAALALSTGAAKKQQKAAEADVLQRRENVPHLLRPLHKIRLGFTTCQPHYMSVSYGFTLHLYQYWQKARFTAVYLRHAPNDLTAEHTMIMLKPLHKNSDCFVDATMPSDWVERFQEDFQRRFLNTLPISFRKVGVDSALSVVLDRTQRNNPWLRKPNELIEDKSQDPKTGQWTVRGVPQLTAAELPIVGLTNTDLRRINAFSRLMIEHTVVLDLMPVLARIYFSKRAVLAPDGTEGMHLTLAQAAVLIGVGMQYLSLEELAQSSVLSSVGVTQIQHILNQIFVVANDYFKKIVPLKDQEDSFTEEGEKAKGGEATTQQTENPAPKRRKMGRPHR